MEQPNYALMKHAWTPRLRSPTRYMAPGTADFEGEFKVYFICWLMINKCQPINPLARQRSRECEGLGKKGRAMADIRSGESFPPPAPLESRLVAASRGSLP